MAIADTISSMYENVGEVYDTITNVDLPTNKNIENIPSTIRKSYLDIMNNGIDTIYDNWEKVNGTGTSLTLNNTEEAPMTIEYKGNTSQETTTGQNLLPNNQTTQTINGVTFTMNSDKSVTITGTATTNTDYYFVGTSSEYEDFGLTTGTYNLNGCTGGSEQTYMLFTVMNRNGNIYYYNNTYAGGRSMIVETGDKFRIFIRVISGKNVNTTIYPQINVGSTALSYEPYTNGASPNPNYPQDIHIVSGDNSIKVEGKNLIPFSDIISTSGTTSNGITFTLQADGTIKANGTATAGISIYLTTNYIEQKAGTYTFSDGIVSGQSGTTFFLYADVRHLDETSWDTKNFSTAETTTRTRTIEEAFKFKPRIVIRQGQTLNNVVFKPMLENGSTATTYEEYKGASYEINLGVENLSPISSMSTTNGGYINSSTGQLGNVIAGKTYTLQFKNNSSYTNQIELRLIHDNTYTNQLTKNLVANSVMEYTFTASHTGYLILSGKVASDVTDIFTEIKTTEGDHIQYISDNPIELCKIGTYQDYIYKENGSWYLHKEIGKVVLDGTQSIPLASGTPRRFNATYTAIGLDNVKSGSSALETQNNYRMCDHFYYASGVNTWGIYYLHNNWLVILDSGSVMADANALKTWLASNNVAIYYVLATPTNTEITDTTLINQLEESKLSYISQTNISQVNNDLPFNLVVKALKNI